MTYFEEITELTKLIPLSIIDFSIPIKKNSPPTQASSNFITNKEQGDWAENLILRAINETSKKYVAVKYGKSDDLIAGEKGFDQFYTDFQNELEVIGKRPDILIFRKEDFNEEFSHDISHFEHNLITDYVKKSIAGLEVRSSAFLIERYEEQMQDRTIKHIKNAIMIKEKILNEYADILEDVKKVTLKIF